MKKLNFIKLLASFFVFTFCLIGFNYQIVKAEDKENIDLNIVLESLEGVVLSEGDTLVIDNYLIECEISTELMNSTKTRAHITEDYALNLKLKISTIFGEKHVATLGHEINYTQFDYGKVHINSATMSFTPIASGWTCDIYDNKIINTDGAYSVSTGMYEINNLGTYYYYGSTATVQAGGNPSITFTAV